MVTKEMVTAAQESWGNAIVAIGALKGSPDISAKTSEIIRSLYAFDKGDILFKPTKAAQAQFRPNHKAALSYFIGEDSDFPEDGGFALQPWTNVRFENANIVLEADRAIAMGNYYFTDKATGGETKVEYTFGYKLINGKLMIDLHHSSLPYNPQPA